MKSTKPLELINWLSESTNIIDLPRDFTVAETKRLIEIAELETLGEDVSDKVKEFKKNWYKDCDIKSKKVKDILNEMSSKLRPEVDLLLSESQVINLIKIAESEI